MAFSTVLFTTFICLVLSVGAAVVIFLFVSRLLSLHKGAGLTIFFAYLLKQRRQTTNRVENVALTLNLKAIVILTRAESGALNNGGPEIYKSTLTVYKHNTGVSPAQGFVEQTFALIPETSTCAKLHLGLCVFALLGCCIAQLRDN